MYVCIYNSDLHLDDPYVDILYYVLQNRGASGSQNKQTNKQKLQHVNQGHLPIPAKHLR